MPKTTPWHEVLETLAQAGWQVRVVPAARLNDVKARLRATITAGEFAAPLAARLEKWTSFELPAAPAAHSVLIGAIARPLTQATLTWRGGEHTIQVPPHYAGYHVLPEEFAAAAHAALTPFGHSAARFKPPLKTLATCSGLARYGRNNITYVEGLGSYLLLAACVSDAPPPADSVWTEPQALERCERCAACRLACPGGAILEQRFLLNTRRCLALYNEETDPMPDWVRPHMHHAAVGCLRCQQACPVNKKAGLVVAAPERFDEAETAAILAAEDPQKRSPETRRKMASCGLDYDPQLMARNIALLLPD